MNRHASPLYCLILLPQLQSLRLAISPTSKPKDVFPSLSVPYRFAGNSYRQDFVGGHSSSRAGQTRAHVLIVRQQISLYSHFAFVALKGSGMKWSFKEDHTLGKIPNFWSRPALAHAFASKIAGLVVDSFALCCRESEGGIAKNPVEISRSDSCEFDYSPWQTCRDLKESLRAFCLNQKPSVRSVRLFIESHDQSCEQHVQGEFSVS